MFKKIIALFFSFAILSSLALPASAEYNSSISQGSIWDQLIIAGINVADDSPVPLLKSIFKVLGAKTSTEICPSSTDNLHHGNPKKLSSSGRSYGVVCTCDYCGADFTASVSSDELNTAYNSYVADLPVSGVGSDGYLYWSPPFSSGYLRLYGNNSYYYYFGNTSEPSTVTQFDVTMTSSYDPVSLSAVSTGSAFSSTPSVRFEFSGVYPVSGYYSWPDSLSFDFYYLDSSGNKVTPSFDSIPYGSSSYRASGSSFNTGKATLISKTYTMTAFHFDVYSPLVKIEPASGLIDTVGDSVYNDNSRTGSLAGNYGYYGDNGEFLVAENIQIVNETDNSVYNPVTNTTENVTNWTYDYSTRSYNLTLDSGEQQTVTYGDEYVTINEGDTVYNIYYTLPEQDTPVEDCQHEYISAVTRDPSCTVPGVTTYTCSKCSHSYTESISALGHTWEVKQQVQTEYDENGELLKSGYIIYRCSVCGEEYKDADGAGPPADSGSGSGSGSSDSGGGGLLDWIKDIIGDGLKKLFESLINGLTKTIDFIFGGDSQSDSDFYNSPSTFSGVSVWA